MASEWDPDEFFRDDNWNEKPDKHLKQYNEELKKKAKEKEELQLKERKAAEKLLVFTLLLTNPEIFNIALSGLQDQILRILGRNGGDGMSKILIFKQNKNEISTGSPIKFSSVREFAKVIIDPFPSEARVNLISELTQELETTFRLVSDETRTSFVYVRVMTRKEAEINF